MEPADFIIIGGGIAGLSAAARLAAHGRTVLVEAESAVGYHASGRSATFSHYGIGDRIVRSLTAASRSFFLAPPDGFSLASLAQTTPALFVATAPMLPALAALGTEMRRYTDTTASADATTMRALCPVLRLGSDDIVAGVLDRGGLRLDSDALLQGYARQLRERGGALLTGCRVTSIVREQARWRVTSESGTAWVAPILVNAAGAWADRIAIMAGVRPLGLTPFRRTIIVVDPPAQADVRGWPFVKTAVDDFYMLPEGGRLMASPTDEVPDEPGDAAPEEYDVAVAADRLERYTTMKVARIAHRWAGLRTFTADRVPVAGFAVDAPGFFWLAGQGGYGLQTAPAMATVTESLVTGSAWPEALARLGVDAGSLAPESKRERG